MRVAWTAAALMTICSMHLSEGLPVKMGTYPSRAWLAEPSLVRHMHVFSGVRSSGGFRYFVWIIESHVQHCVRGLGLRENWQLRSNLGECLNTLAVFL